MIFSESEIAGIAFPSIVERGKELHESGAVRSLQVVGSDAIARVCHEAEFRVVVGEAEGQFACTCGFSMGGACEHVVAAMLALSRQEAVQTGLLLEPGDSRGTDERVGREPPPVEEVRGKPRGRLYLTERGSMLLVELRFAYHGGCVEFCRGDPQKSRVVPDGAGGFRRIVRARARELALVSEMSEYGLAPYQAGTFTPAGDAHEWVLETLPALAARGCEIFGESKLRSFRAREAEPELTVSVSRGDGLLECDISARIAGVPVELAAIFQAARDNNRYVRLTDGTTGVLPEAWLRKFASLFAVLDHQGENGRVRVRPAQLPALEMLCEMADHTEGDEGFAAIRERFRGFTGIGRAPLPEGFRGELRPYQQAGYDWLCFLREHGFGGCLADDMGLGKTVQALVYLLSEKRRSRRSKPSLVVVPTSLLFNWEREARKFTPELSVLVYHGAGRHRYDAVLHMADVVLTTYGSVLRDREHLGNIPFHVMVLDEAQAIKNHTSRIARAVRSIRARQRITLSGTPVENNLAELWSAFAFISPGLLGSYTTFSSFYARPIERDNCEERAEILRRLTYPFILRRTKEQVATELPPKTEMVLYADMLPRQKTLYEVTRELYHGRIASMIDREGMEKASMQVLEGLLRLRQICCHPLLVDRNFGGDSGKFRLLDESLEEIVGGGHRVLVFSQFVSALEILAERLRRRKLACEILTGKTRNRARVVDRFQTDPSIPVFLISLKAGGVGLNLTAADYVIHLDPWWNPAVERQASDRAYRIGQTRNVFVYKMITTDSVEERVLALQERKQALIRSVITTESGFFKKLSPQEVLGLFSNPAETGGRGSGSGDLAPSEGPPLPECGAA